MSQDELAVMDGRQVHPPAARGAAVSVGQVRHHPAPQLQVHTADADPKNAFSIEDFLRARLKLKPNQVCDVYEIDAAADD